MTYRGGQDFNISYNTYPCLEYAQEMPAEISLPIVALLQVGREKNFPQGISGCNVLYILSQGGAGDECERSRDLASHFPRDRNLPMSCGTVFFSGAVTLNRGPLCGTGLVVQPDVAKCRRLFFGGGG